MNCSFKCTLWQGWANLFNRRVIGRKQNTPASCKISGYCQHSSL